MSKNTLPSGWHPEASEESYIFSLNLFAVDSLPALPIPRLKIIIHRILHELR